MASRPRTIEELIRFYYDKFKPIYSHVQLLNNPPIELFFEINACFDHLSRHWEFGESEERCVSSAAAHLKRGCFDAFKIILRESRSHYDKLLKVDLSIIDNGEFERQVVALFGEIKQGAIKARSSEGDSRSNGRETEEQWNKAFDLWESVYEKCVRLEQEFFLNPKVEWARRKGQMKTAKVFGCGVLASLVATIICLPFTFPRTNVALPETTNTQGSPAPQIVSEPTNAAGGHRPVLSEVANPAGTQPAATQFSR